MHSHPKMVRKNVISAMLKQNVKKITVNPLTAKVLLTLAIPWMLNLLGSLQLQGQKGFRLQILCMVKFSEKTPTLPVLTHLRPEVDVCDGQISPDCVTGPCWS